MLSYAYWKSRFAGDPGVVGKTVIINGHSMVVIGVAEQGFDGVELGLRAQIFVPAVMKGPMLPLADDINNRRSRWVR